MCDFCRSWRDLPQSNRVIERERLTLAATKAQVKALQDQLSGGTPADTWQRLALKYEKKMRSAAVELEKQSISMVEWRRKVDSLLREMHVAAHGAGQSMATDQVMLSVAGQAGRRVADLESQYLQGFFNDLRAGKYTDDDGIVQSEKMMARLRLYVQRSRGTAGEGFALHGKEFRWILGAVEDHCEDCPVLAGGGPYDMLTLYTHPGSGDTPCLGNCKCYLVNQDDARGPMPFGVS